MNSTPDHEALARVCRLAQVHATGAHARGDFEEERRWLDVLALLERAGVS